MFQKQQRVVVGDIELEKSQVHNGEVEVIVLVEDGLVVALMRHHNLLTTKHQI